MDFFVHERGIATLFCGFCIPLHFEFARLDDVAVIVGDLDVIGSNSNHLIIVNDHSVFGIVNKSGNIRAQEILAFATTNQQRRVTTGSHNPVRLINVHGQQGECTRKPSGTTHRFCQISVGLGSENVGKQGASDLGVRV